jgi:hypothetical protein
MVFRIVEVLSEDDFLEVIECQWAAYEAPFQPFFRMFCPLRDNNRDGSLLESASRQWQWHQADPHSKWLKVVDDNEVIVGACLWKVYESNPFEEHHDEQVDWYPADESREYVEAALEIMDGPRMRLCPRPHVCKTLVSPSWLVPC